MFIDFYFKAVLLNLVLGSVFFTIYFRFINVKAFKHAFSVIRGNYDKKNDVGQINHFQALTTALSATIGLGNIAGVAVAVKSGGPGAVFWMVCFSFFSMSAKFVSATLSQIYRKQNRDGSIDGGPMYYLSIGLKKYGRPLLGRVLALIYAVFIIGGALGGGNMFQANQSTVLFMSILGESTNQLSDPRVGDLMALFYKNIYALVLVFLVGIVIIGGIKRIARTTEKLVPSMIIIYVVSALYVIFYNLEQTFDALLLIIRSIHDTEAVYGGFLGVLITGIQRAAFSNEGGVGSASIAHAAAKTDEPVREGIVAMVGPFFDTMLVCLMTALVIVISQKYNIDGAEGILLTDQSFSHFIPYFNYILYVVVFCFSYSTMIAWYYYGDKGWRYIFGSDFIMVYKVLYLVCVYIGSLTELKTVIDFSDAMIFGCTFPNIIGCLFLLPVVKKMKIQYVNLKSFNKF